MTRKQMQVVEEIRLRRNQRIRLDAKLKNKEVEWITVNGTHIPLTEDKKLAGKIGKKIEAQSRASKKFGKVKSTNPKEKSQKHIDNSPESATIKAVETPSENANPSHGTAKATSGASTGKRSSYVHDTPDTRDFMANLEKGLLYAAEELMSHPVIKWLDKESLRWDKKYPSLKDDNSPKRVAMRENIKREFLSMGSAVRTPDGEYKFTGKVDRGFEAEIVIGLPASGKSTTIANPDSEALKAFVFDSDIIKESIPEFKESHGAAANAVHEESKLILESVLSEFKTGGARNGDNLIIPVIGSDYDSLFEDWIKPLEDSGYNVKIKFKDTDPVVSMNRNIGRAISRGRIIPSHVSLRFGNRPKKVYERFAKEKAKNRKGNPYV